MRVCVCVCVFIDVSCVCPADYVGNGDFCNGVLMNVLATNSNFSIFYNVSVTHGPRPYICIATPVIIVTHVPLSMNSSA